MMSLTFGLFTQVSGSGPLGPLVYVMGKALSGYPVPVTVLFAENCEEVILGFFCLIFLFYLFIIFFCFVSTLDFMFTRKFNKSLINSLSMLMIL